jgi:hypothetical protein
MHRLGKIPITVGIAGHPDTIITEQHRIEIENLFKDLADAYPHSPVYLFTTIAKAVDRFASNIFLELKTTNEKYNEKFELIIILPGEEKTNDEPDKETSDLLKKAKNKIYISSRNNISDGSDYSFESLKFVADSSLIFIALWDGINTEKGGISDVINYKIYGDENDVAKSTFEYKGTAIIMPCDRYANEGQNSDRNKIKIKLSLEQISEDTSIRQTLDKIEEINADSLEISLDTLKQSQRNLAENPQELFEPEKSILDIYSILDTLSVHYHRRYNKTVVWLFITGLFIVTSFGIYTNLWLNRITLTIAIGLILLAGVIYFFTTVTKHHTKYIYNRTLAEAFRIQFYWNIAGINNKVSDYILRIHRKEFIWIDHILSVVYGITYISRPITSSAINTLTINWVKSQADFFESSIKKMTQKMVNYRLISNISFIASFALLLSIFFLERIYLINNLMGFLQVVIGSLLGIAALIRGYVQIKGYSQLLNQYELMNVLYQKAETKINQIISTSTESEKQFEYLKELFFIIGKESLIENGTWYLILKDKEPGIEGI